MAEADFEFYEMPGFDGDFVIPKPANDFYGGLEHPKDAADLALGSVTDVVERLGLPFNVESLEVKTTDFDGYFFKQIPGTLEVTRQRFGITVELVEEEGRWYSEAMNTLFRLMTTGTHALMERPADGSPKPPNQLSLIREGDGSFLRADLFNDDESPRNPSLTEIRQIVPIRAYRWQAGPERKLAADDSRLPPTWNPRPVQIAIAQLIDITGLNPKVGSQA